MYIIYKKMKFIGDRFKLFQDTRIIGSNTQSNLSAFHSAGKNNLQTALPLTTIFNYSNSNQYHIKLNEDLTSQSVFRRLIDYQTRVLIYDLQEETIPIFLLKIIETYNFIIPNNRYVIYIQFDVLKLNNDKRSLNDIVHFFLQLAHPIFISPHFLGFVIIWIDKLKEKQDILDTIINRELGIEGISLSNVENMFISNFASNKYRNSLFHIARLSKNKESIYCNDFEQVSRYYGIEAARYVLYQELSSYMDKDSAINIANDKTHYGKILYYNTNNPFIRKKGTLAEMSIRSPFNSIKNSIVNSKGAEECWSVLSQFMVGQNVQLGLQDKTIIYCSECHEKFSINHWCHIK